MRTKPIAVAAIFVASVGASLGSAQTAPTQSQVFDFTNKPTQQGLQEIATILRTVGDIKQLTINSAASTITVGGTTDQLAMTGWMIHQLDQPVPADPTAPQPTAASAQQYLVAGKSDDVIRVFHLTAVAPAPPQAIQEILTTLRTVANVQKVFNYTALSDLVVRGPAAQVLFSEFLIDSLDMKKGSPTPATSGQFQYQAPGMGTQAAQVFYLANANTPQAVQEILTTLRTVADIQKVFCYTPLAAIAILGSANDLAAAAFLIQSLDIPAAPKTGQTPNIREFQMAANAKENPSLIRVFYPAYLTTPRAVQETLTILRSVLALQQAFNNSKPVALIYRGSADQIAKADQLIQQADKPVQTASATTRP